VNGTRFRGSVVTSFVSKGWPLDSLSVRSDHLEFKSLVDLTEVRRDETRAIEFHRQRFPIMVRTFVVARLKDGSTHERMFVPWRTRAIRRSLIRLGWPVQDTTRQTLLSPRPD
jgi:hypothetical protein